MIPDDDLCMMIYVQSYETATENVPWVVKVLFMAFFLQDLINPDSLGPFC